ncbi:MAG TPA: tetratricopeptide repeat protein, partial [Candidatus Wallbacteria bacterium]|nr:tetratricopeptide repeat protein [Candidatus Wallbacteria bacterium]
MNSAGNNIARLFKFLKDNPALAGSLNIEALIAQIEQSVSDFSCDNSIKLEYSDMLINFDRYDKANEVIHQLIDSDSNNFFAYYLQAKCYYLKGALKEAQYPIIKCLELQPNYDEGRFLLAKIFLKARQYEKAQRIFEYYQKISPYERRSEIYIAKCLYNSGGSEAAAAYSEALLKDKNAVHPYIAMLYAYHLSNIEQYDRAFAVIYEHAFREGVSPLEKALLNMANVFLLSLSAKNDNFEDFMSEASSLLKDASEIAGISNQPLFLLYRNFAATIYNMKLKNYRRMNAAAEMVFSYKNNYDVEDYVMFEFEEFTNIYSLAKLQSLKSEAEKDVETGCMHINANNFNAGVKYLEGADAKMPGDISILNRLGESYILINQMNKAIQTFEKIKKIDPKNIESYKRTSEIYMSIGNYEKFISECRQILAMDPEDFYSRFYIGEYLFKNGNYPEAEEFLRYLINRIENEFKSVRPSDITMISKELYEKASFIMAQIAFKDGVRENAILYLNNVININPENEKAYDLLNKLKQSRQDKEVMLLLREADEKENEKDYIEAMHVFENIIEINPQFIEAHYRLAKNLMKQKNFERALF